MLVNFLYFACQITLEHDDPSYTYVFIVDEGTSPPIIGNFRQFFELFGIIDRLVFLNEPTQYDKVIIPGRSFQYNRFFYPEYLKIFDRVIENAYRSATVYGSEKRVFLSRSCFDRAVKSEVGLEMLDSFFSRNSYKIIYPERISLSDLIVLIGNSDECASESGSSAHNFLFCPYGHKTMIMERHTAVNKAQVSIDIVRGLKTVYADCHLDIVPVYPGAGPFFLYFTPCMEKLTADRDYLPPADEFIGWRYLKKGLETYKQMYREIYEDAIPDYSIFEQYKDELIEAENESNQIVSEFGLTSVFDLQ